MKWSGRFLFPFIAGIAVSIIAAGTGAIGWRGRHLLGLLTPDALGVGDTIEVPDEFFNRLVSAAMERTSHTVRYVSTYRNIPYPNGDVPGDTGVCTDEVIRVYRKLGIDLQQAVHEDMNEHFALYPKYWKLTAPDPNIDHRRVPNLVTYFRNRDALLPITGIGEDYRPGDVVAWNLGVGPHIGIVVNRRVPRTDRFYIMHNIGRGPELEDFLFQAKIVAHIRFRPQSIVTFGPGVPGEPFT